METQKHILGLAKNIGFILQGKIDMVTAQYQNQYLYLLYKPLNNSLLFYIFYYINIKYG